MTDSHELISAYFDQTLSEAKALELSAWIAGHPSHAMVFARFAALHRRLQERFAAEAMILTLDDDIATPDGRGRGSGLRLTARRPSTSTPGRIARYPHVPFWPAMAAAVLMVASLTLIVLRGRSGTATSQGQASSIATTLVNTTDAQWDAPYEGLQSGAALPPGPVFLKTGLAEIRYGNGVTMLIEAPARLTVRAANGVDLNHGKIVAVVPANARGFAVQTPSARVVDLGTEFGVEVSDDQSTRFEVFRGSVRAEVIGSGGTPITQTFVADQAARIPAGGAGIQLADQFPLRFVRPAEMSSTALSVVRSEYPSETHAIPTPRMEDLPLAEGPFKGTVESLQQYQCPDWFRDGKFGIWAHWGPQAVAGDGDWFAQHMYEEGGGVYEDHLKNYGHPSKVGYKDIVQLWKAEKWDPDRLMALYKAAGAHYFVAQAVHYDNFDNWNSKYQKWNSVNMGPHKDMVGIWQRAAKKQGLRFGVSEHLGHSFTFMQAAHGSDRKGPLAGVPYDGANPAWSDLYQLPAKSDDGAWYTNDPRWIPQWYARIYDLVSQYKPDLLYSDGGVPYGKAGLSIVAQLYNLSTQQSEGKLQALYSCKKNYPGTDFYDGVCVADVERGGMNDIQSAPWQTDISTGDWYYNKHDQYKSSKSVIRSLTDIVSKNGTLLLNVVLYPDGSLPPEMETFLGEMADWMKINGEAIFGTRPWTIHGEGPTAIRGGAFNENFDARDIRFTRKGDDIYATTLGVPTGQLVIHALASDSPLVTGKPTKVALLGANDQLTWSRTADGILIQVPANAPSKSALCFKISGLTTVAGLSPQAFSSFTDRLRERSVIVSVPDPDGSIHLPASAAQLQGSTIQIEGEGDQSHIDWWEKPAESISWKFKTAKAGTYQVAMEMSAEEGDSEFTVVVGSQQLAGKSIKTGGWGNYKMVEIGPIKIEAAGPVPLKLSPKSSATWKPINVRSVRLTPIP